MNESVTIKNTSHERKKKTIGTSTTVEISNIQFYNDSLKPFAHVLVFSKYYLINVEATFGLVFEIKSTYMY